MGCRTIWEAAFGLNPTSDTGIDGAAGDPDGDGLTNLTEFRIETNPRSTNTDGQGLDDDAEDFDGDGLTNLFEQDVSNTLAHLSDTDGDQMDDGD